MILRVFYLLSALLLISCIDSNETNAYKRMDSKALSTKKLPAKQKKIIAKISPGEILFTDTITVADQQYISYLCEELVFILNAQKDTVFSFNTVAQGTEFKDFNEDGFADLFIHYTSNVPNICDLALLDNNTRSFRLVEDFDSYPTSVKIGKTDFYYSYHRSGCADSNWDSDLFKIENYKVVPYGNIQGLGCEGDEKTGIFISMIQNNKFTPIAEFKCKSGYYKDKWDFIEKYWRGNYSKFDRTDK